MANKLHWEMLVKGARAWNEWQEENLRGKPDLRDARIYAKDLRGAILNGADFHQAHLDGANLSGAWLQRANLEQSFLLKVDLNEASLDGANLSNARLNGADLRGAALGGVDFHGADLSDVNFEEAQMGFTSLAAVDLSTAKGLETVRHVGASSIGIDTIYRSKGNIPVEFLRGAGVPDNFIEYMRSLTGKALEYYSCFISYSSNNQDFAERLYADLQTNGVRCWFAPHHVQSGKKLHEQIDNAIRLHERLLLILSPDSINSEWVKTEIAKARQREVKEKRRVLFPVKMGISFEQLKDWEYFDSDIGKSSAREIREYYIPDFSKWKAHDSYQGEFAKLLRDLKKADESRAVGGMKGSRDS